MSRTRASFVACLMLACLIAAAVPASAQHFQLVGGLLSQVAAGRNEVWGLNGSQPYRFNPSTKTFVEISDEISGPLLQIAVGGGSLLESDQVWGISASGLVYRYNFSTKDFVYVAGGIECKFCLYVGFSQIAVGEAVADETGCHPYEVWALGAPLGQPTTGYRYNYCAGSLEQIPLPVGSTTRFTHIATGGGDTWALDANAHIWLYNQYEKLWEQVTNGGYFGTLQQISVGVGIYDVWGLDGNGAAYRYDSGSGAFLPSGIGFAVTQIAAGGDGVWALAAPSAVSPNCNVFHVDGELQPFCLSQDATQIAVGSGAGVWVLNGAKQVNALVRP